MENCFSFASKTAKHNEILRKRKKIQKRNDNHFQLPNNTISFHTNTRIQASNMHISTLSDTQIVPLIISFYLMHAQKRAYDNNNNNNKIAKEEYMVEIQNTRPHKGPCSHPHNMLSLWRCFLCVSWTKRRASNKKKLKIKTLTIYLLHTQTTSLNYSLLSTFFFCCSFLFIIIVIVLRLFGISLKILWSFFFCAHKAHHFFLCFFRRKKKYFSSCLVSLKHLWIVKNVCVGRICHIVEKNVRFSCFKHQSRNFNGFFEGWF